jgi:hypothetical protein
MSALLHALIVHRRHRAAALRTLLPRTAMQRLAPLFVLLLAAAPALHAQGARSHTDGLFLHARTGGHGIAFEDAGDDTGASIGLRAGYGFSDRFTLYVGLEGGGLDGQSRLQGLDTDQTSGVAYVELGGRYHFRPGHRFVPYADAALTLIGVGSENDAYDGDVGYGGAGLSVGGGALYFVTPSIAVEGGVSFTPGSLMERELGGASEDVSVGVAGVRMHVGLTLYPFR